MTRREWRGTMHARLPAPRLSYALVEPTDPPRVGHADPPAAARRVGVAQRRHVAAQVHQQAADALQPAHLPDIIATANAAEKKLRVLVRRVVAELE